MQEKYLASCEWSDVAIARVTVTKETAQRYYFERNYRNILGRILHLPSWAYKPSAPLFDTLPEAKQFLLDHLAKRIECKQNDIKDYQQQIVLVHRAQEG